MNAHAPNNQLEKKLFRAFMLISAMVIVLLLLVTLCFEASRQQNETDALISGSAAFIAALPEVATVLENGYPSPTLNSSLNSFCSNIPNISVAMVCDKNGLRFFHTDRLKTGESLIGGEEKDILAGKPPYITVGYGTMGMQRRAFHAVRNPQGDIVGFVMVSVFNGVLLARMRSLVLIHLLIFAVMLAISFLLSHTSILFLRKTLMGFGPEELLHLYLRQDEVLGAMAEGLVATDTQGNVLFVNHATKLLLSRENEDLTGQPLQSLLPDSDFRTVIASGQPRERRSWVVNGHTVLANEIPIRRNSESPVEGVLTMLYDRTEMLRMSDELFGAKSMIDALRAYNHEFSNKLHVILGFIESGQVAKAARFITNSNLISSQLICQTADQLRVSELCALVVGKMMHAAERGITLKLLPQSCCIEQDLLIPTPMLITVAGNLLENAIEALSDDTHPLREIKFGLFCRPDCNIIVCEDSGKGIDSQTAARIFEKGFSTKGSFRGMGLYSVASIVSQYHGKIALETENGEGSCFTITFTREERDACIM